MKILIVGAHFYNKGAHLMMKTVVEQFKDFDDVEIYLSPCAGSHQQIKQLGYKTINFPLKHVTAYRSFDIFFKFGKVIRYLKKEYRGDLSINEIDAVLDISGFAYSDQWGEGAVKNVNKLIRFFKKNGAKYIFLSQAFGPFSSELIKNEMRKAIDGSDLVIVRDKDSERMIKELNNSKNIKRYPDITIGLSAPKPQTVLSDYSCLVPNERMLDQGSQFWPEGKYMEYMCQAIEALLQNSKDKIFLLVHDNGRGDVVLANELKSMYNEEDRISVYFEKDPVKLKSFLGQANIIIGSRYHALVSALSQNVPSLALGWSHKYKMLFEEYGIESFSLSTPDDLLFPNLLIELTTVESKKELESCITKSNDVLKMKNKQMWNEVLEILDL